MSTNHLQVAAAARMYLSSIEYLVHVSHEARAQLNADFVFQIPNHCVDVCGGQRHQQPLAELTREPRAVAVHNRLHDGTCK
jgi:hypothetical protein